MRTVVRKIFRDLIARRARTFLVAASIFIGVMGVITLFTMSDLVVGNLEASIQPERLSMINIYVTLRDDTPPDNEAFLESLRELPDVEIVRGLGIYPVYWRLESDTPYTTGNIFGYDSGLDSVFLEPFEKISGRYPAAGQQELMVERRFAEAHNLSAGDTLLVRVVSSGQEQPWTITGTVAQPYQYPTLPGAPAQIPGDQMVFAHFSDVQLITGISGYRMIQVRYDTFASAEAGFAELKALIGTSDSPYQSLTSLIEDPHNNSLTQRITIFGDVLTFLAAMSLLVSGFLVLNVINTIIIEQRRQIGVMKALGASGADAFLIYAGMALIYGCIGVVPGVLTGIPAGYYGSVMVGEALNVYVGEFAVSWQAVSLGIAMGLIVPVVAAIIPVLLGIRVTILDAMTDRGIRARYGHGLLGQALDFLPLPLGLRMAFRSAIARKWRLLLTVSTLSLAAGAFMGIYALLTSFNNVVDSVFGTVGMQISINPNGPEDQESITDLVLANVSGIESIEPGTTLSIDIEGYTPQSFASTPSFLFAFGFNTEHPDVISLELREGEAWQRDASIDGVVISAGIADRMDKEVGDTITIRAGSGPETLPVIGVAMYAFDTIWMRWETLSSMGGLVGNLPPPNSYTTTVTLQDSPVTAVGVSRLAESVLVFDDGQFIEPGEMMISGALAERLNVAAGDTLRVAAGATPREFVVSGVFNLAIETDFTLPEEAVAFYRDDLLALEGRTLTGDPRPNSLQVILENDDASPGEVDQKITEINDVLLDNGITATYTNWVANLEGLTRLLTTAGIVLNIAAALIGAVGGVGLLSTLSMSVFERQKEIGVMRSIGAVSRIIALQFLIEGWFIGLLAWLIGLPISYWLNDFLLGLFDFRGIPGTEYPPQTMLLGLLGMFILTTIASLFPALGAARRTVSDVLRYA